MGSIKAQRVARKMSESVLDSKPITLEKIMVESGYAPSTAKKPSRVLQSKSFQAAILTETSPLIEGLQMQINRIKQAMLDKDMSAEDMRTLAYSLDVLTKNYQLLSGGATERQVFVLPSQVMERNTIAPSDQKQLSDNGSTEPQNNVQ